MSEYEKIESAYQKALSGIALTKPEIVGLLRIETSSEECAYLRRKAHEASLILTNHQAYMWRAIGLDYAACSMSCDFCSFGSAWGLIETEKVYTLPEIISKVEEYVSNQVHFIVLRTTQYYSLETINEYVRSIREAVKGAYEIVINVGEFDVDMANSLHENGVSAVYHAIRLREGVDTHFKVEARSRTLSAVKASRLNLVHLVEPVGEEHTYEEIADRFLCSLEYDTYISGIMARIPVKGTPLGDSPRISDEEIAKMIAVLRLSGGQTVRNICVHPASSLALRSGANVVVIETGAIPRDQALAEGKWLRFDYNAAKQLFTENGFTVTP